MCVFSHTSWSQECLCLIKWSHNPPCATLGWWKPKKRVKRREVSSGQDFTSQPWKTSPNPGTADCSQRCTPRPPQPLINSTQQPFLPAQLDSSTLASTSPASAPGFGEPAAGKGRSPLIPSSSSSLFSCEGPVWPQGGRVAAFFNLKSSAGMKTAMKALTFLENHWVSDLIPLCLRDDTRGGRACSRAGSMRRSVEEDVTLHSGYELVTTG